MDSSRPRGSRRAIGLAALSAVVLAGCQSIPSSGDPLSPVTVRAAAPAAPNPTAPVAAAASPVEPAPAAGDGFAFEREDRDDAADRVLVEEDPLALQARLLGVDPSVLQAPAPTPTPAPVAAPPAPAAPVLGAWDPTQPLPDGSFGVRLLVTMHDMQPPMAVLGLPNGEERVVHPGDFLTDPKLVVMAIGRDVVQVAKITPAGFYARVDTQNVVALFPAQRAAPLTP